MKKEKHIYLAAIRRELQAQYRYESREKRNHAFEVLYYGWRRRWSRRGRNSTFFTLAWQRAWLNKIDADDLREYIGLC